MASTREIQREPIVTDDLSIYRGSWVAVRDGQVVADAIDPVELRDKPEVREDDVIFLVPTESGKTLML
ncbi:MAG TPA: succinyl-CoA synthetase subunit alpha [Acidimicrobiaceae bacterium]|nr:succinyl-CoA synthetase subunit alpha [Acidimicrobiaceae bacterium]